jgi:hypothetical protein
MLAKNAGVISDGASIWQHSIGIDESKRLVLNKVINVQTTIFRNRSGGQINPETSSLETKKQLPGNFEKRIAVWPFLPCGKRKQKLPFFSFPVEPEKYDHIIANNDKHGFTFRVPPKMV